MLTRTTVAFSRPQLEYLREEAERLGLSLGDTVRRIVDQHRAAHEQPPQQSQHSPRTDPMPGDPLARTDPMPIPERRMSIEHDDVSGRYVVTVRTHTNEYRVESVGTIAEAIASGVQLMEHSGVPTAELLGKLTKT
jgi:hypothetical protein